MSKIEVYNGEFFDFSDPDPSVIEAEDIAHALSNLCRFNGHTEEFYSVGEHCVLMTKIVEPEYRSWALMHDAGEAYIGDLPTPLKTLLLPEIRDIEEAILKAVVSKYDLETYGSSIYPEEIHTADLQMLRMEKEKVQCSNKDWPVFSDLDVKMPDIQPQFWNPPEARRQFLDAFHSLVD